MFLCAFYTRFGVIFIVSAQNELPHSVLLYPIKTECDALISHFNEAVVPFIFLPKHDPKQARAAAFIVIDEFNRKNLPLAEQKQKRFIGFVPIKSFSPSQRQSGNGFVSESDRPFMYEIKVYLI